MGAGTSGADNAVVSSEAGLPKADAEAVEGREATDAPAHPEDDAWLAMVAADPALYLKDAGETGARRP
jgi:hypothetical protein